MQKIHCLFITALCAFLTISSANAEDLSDCPQLLYYADNQLANEWQAEVLRVARAEDSIAIMKRARNDLLDVGLIEEYARTRGPELAHAIHIVSVAMFNALSMGAGGTGKKGLLKIVKKARGKVTRTQVEIAEFITTPGAVNDIFTYQSEVAAVKILASQVPYLGDAVNLFWDFAEGIKNQKYIRASGEELRAVTAGYLDRIDEKLAQYHQQLKVSSESIAARDAIGGAIEQRCGWLREGSARTRPVNPESAPHGDGITSPVKSSSNAQDESWKIGWYFYHWEVKTLDPRSPDFGNVVKKRSHGHMDITQCQKSRGIKRAEMQDGLARTRVSGHPNAGLMLQQGEHTLSTLTDCRSGTR